MRRGASALGMALCVDALGCGPPPYAPPQGSYTSSDASSDAGTRSSAVYGNVEPDPLLDPSVFEVEKPREDDARRAAEDRCGGRVEFILSRVVQGTKAGKCEKTILSGLLRDSQTSRGRGAVVCTPSTDASDRTVHRYRCTKR